MKSTAKKMIVMPIIVEHFVLPILSAAMVALILLNPLKFDRVQQWSLGIAIVAAAIFVGRTWDRKKSDASKVQTQPATIVPPTESGTNQTKGQQSPIVIGNGNTFNYGNSNEPTGDKRHRRSK